MRMSRRMGLLGGKSGASPILNNNEWDVISAISTAGEGENYWSVGDRKEITLDGTVGHLTLSNFTTCAFIIGFNHNSSVEGSGRIHFQLAKTALSGGTDIAFCDSKYNSNVSSTGYFSMNSSNTNSGGWERSQMRNNICGTSLSSYSGTIIAVIPEALRAVLKSVTKYTDNTGGGGVSTASYVTATTDYFFLLSEYEVFRKNANGNTNESSKQKQYAYYSSGNSKRKYRHSSPDSTAAWWLRSVSVDNGGYFCACGTSGSSSSSMVAALNSRGFAPGFCV